MSCQLSAVCFSFCRYSFCWTGCDVDKPDIRWHERQPTTGWLRLNLRYSGILDLQKHKIQSCLRRLYHHRYHFLWNRSHVDLNCRCAEGTVPGNTRFLLCNSHTYFPGCWQARTVGSYLRLKVQIQWCRSLQMWLVDSLYTRRHPCCIGTLLASGSTGCWAKWGLLVGSGTPASLGHHRWLLCSRNSCKRHSKDWGKEKLFKIVTVNSYEKILGG